MKKTILFFGILFTFLFLFSGFTSANPCGSFPNPFFVGPVGPSLHPDTDGSIVPCGQYSNCRCDLADVRELFLRVYIWVLGIGTSLASLGIVLGGILIMISGGPGGTNPVTGIASPNMYNRGKQMITGCILGLILIWCAWLIIHTFAVIIGYTGPI